MINGANWRHHVDEIVTDRGSSLRVGLLLPLVVMIGCVVFWLSADVRIHRQRTVLLDGPLTPSSQDLWAYLRTTYPPETVFVFRKPFALSLYTDRRSHVIIPLETPSDTGAVEQAYRENRVSYFVYDREASVGTIEDWLNRFLDNSGHVHEVWRNERYIVYGWNAS